MIYIRIENRLKVVVERRNKKVAQLFYFFSLFLRVWKRKKGHRTEKRWRGRWQRETESKRGKEKCTGREKVKSQRSMIKVAANELAYRSNERGKNGKKICGKIGKVFALSILVLRDYNINKCISRLPVWYALHVWLCVP